MHKAKLARSETDNDLLEQNSRNRIAEENEKETRIVEIDKAEVKSESISVVQQHLVLLQLSTNMRIEGHKQFKVTFPGVQKLQEIHDIVDVLLDNRIGRHEGADAHILPYPLPVTQNGVPAKAVAGSTEVEMLAVCADNAVLGTLVETEFRDTRHVLLLPSSFHLLERTSREVTVIVLLHQEFVGGVGDHTLNLGVQNRLYLGVQSNGSSVLSDDAGFG